MKHFSFWRFWLVSVLICAAGSLVKAQARAGARDASGQPAARTRMERGGAPERRDAARRFLAQRGLGVDGRALLNARQSRTTAMAGRVRKSSEKLNPKYDLSSGWTQVGPAQTLTPAYGRVTGRVTGIAIDPSDATGNTVFLATTGGGVWGSTNAESVTADVTFLPLTDQVPSVQSTGVGSLSIGAVTVQPGGTGVVLAGTGDPNDALDSYYGEGILRSADHGVTWSSIAQSVDAAPHSFAGEGFAGFAWSSVAPGTVVAAVTQALDGLVVNATESNSVEGLYYSTDAGLTWQLSTISDGAPGDTTRIVQSATSGFGSYDGNAATAVVWNPVRRLFYAAIRYHGYYQSVDGATWTRLVNQPGVRMSLGDCPTNQGFPGNLVSCPVFRGALAVQAQTGDLFAITVDINDADQGLWRDVCGGCSAGSVVSFGTQIADVPIKAGLGDTTIPQGNYDLWLAAVPAGADTALYVGTEDIYKCSLAEGCAWRNTTNVNSCASAMVAPSQHAVDFVGPLMYFGNDSGLWRTTDGINQQAQVCSADDATHFNNLNEGLGSLSEVSSIAQSTTNGGTLMVAELENGIAGTTAVQTAWPQMLDGFGEVAAIDPVNGQNWYASSGPGVSISFCGSGGACNAAGFAAAPIVGDAQTASDGEQLINPAVWMLDPQSPSVMIVGTCRVWRGSVAGGIANWTAANALSSMLDLDDEAQCDGNAQIRSLGASGTLSTPLYGPGTTQEILYVGMDGTLDGGGTAAGHVYTASVSANAVGPSGWTDLFASPVVNGGQDGGQFNPGGFAVSSVVADTHDSSGQTVYVTIEGQSGKGFSGIDINEPTVYRSTNQGQSWTNITANLPDVVVNGLLVDPANANIVYVATDAGVYVATDVTTCAGGQGECWSVFGTGMPDVPVTALAAWGSGGTGLLRAATYGRGVWQTALASAAGQGGPTPTTISVNPTSLTFGAQQEGTLSAAQSVTVTNSGSAPLTIASVQVTGDYSEQNDCSGVIAPEATCVVTIAFSPTAQGERDGQSTLFANVPGGQATVTLSGTGGLPGQVVPTPILLAFPSTVLGLTSAVQFITLSNSGTTAASIVSPEVTGDFQLVSNTCGASEVGQASCTIGITFTPSVYGLDSGVFTVVTDAVSLTVPLSGTGLAPGTIVLYPVAGLVFPDTVQGQSSAALQINVANIGGAPVTVQEPTVAGDFQIVSNACAGSVAGGSSCLVNVVFTPTGTGVRHGTFSISTGNGVKTDSLGGNGVPPGQVVINPASVVFPGTAIGATSPVQYITISNTAAGGTSSTLQTPAMTGSFQITSNTCTASLAGQGSCTVGIVFTPTVSGAAQGTFTIVTGTGTLAALLSGAGQAPATDGLSASALQFGTQLVGTTSAAQTVVISNTGDQALTGITVASSLADFAVAAPGCLTNVPGHQSCAVVVTFAPVEAGLRSGTLTITDVLRSQTVALTGTGLAPSGVPSVGPLALSFGSAGVLGSPGFTASTLVPQSVTVTNNGSTAMTGMTFPITGDFAVSNTTCGSSLAPKAACIVTMLFTPTATGTRTGILTITGGDAEQSLTTSLTGTGIEFMLNTAVPATQTVISGATSAPYMISIQPGGTSTTPWSGELTLTCASQVATYACSAGSGSVELVNGQSASVTVLATPVATSSGRREGSGWPFGVGGLAMACVVPLWTIRRRKIWSRTALGIVAAGLLLIAGCGLTTKSSGGGGGSGGSGGGGAGASSTLTVTASAAGIAQSVTMTLVVEQ